MILPEEDDVLPPGLDGDIIVLHPREGVLQGGELVVMGGKEGLGPQLQRAVLQHRPGDGHAVKGAGAPADLVQNEEAALVAQRRISLTSFISTMKVDWPLERSSLAPMRVKIRSTRPMRAARAGTKDPIWAMRTMRATWRI